MPLGAQLVVAGFERGEGNVPREIERSCLVRVGDGLVVRHSLPIYPTRMVTFTTWSDFHSKKTLDLCAIGYSFDQKAFAFQRQMRQLMIAHFSSPRHDLICSDTLTHTHTHTNLHPLAPLLKIMFRTFRSPFLPRAFNRRSPNDVWTSRKRFVPSGHIGLSQGSGCWFDVLYCHWRARRGRRNACRDIWAVGAERKRLRHRLAFGNQTKPVGRWSEPDFWPGDGITCFDKFWTARSLLYQCRFLYQILIFQQFSRSTRFVILCTAPNSKFLEKFVNIFVLLLLNLKETLRFDHRSRWFLCRF